MGIKDEFHQKNILVCIEELCQPSPPPPPVATETTGPTTPSVDPANCPLGVGYPGNNATNNAHNLVPHSFSVLEKCDKCHKYLRGLLHQGFLCQDCGLVSHRTCSATGLPANCISASDSDNRIGRFTSAGAGSCELYDRADGKDAVLAPASRCAASRYDNLEPGTLAEKRLAHAPCLGAPHCTSPHLTSPHLTSPYLTSWLTTFFH
ncbi:Calcium-dependent protein kinase C [Harpegnathos saltator]|uniref:Calcium-dependent protein kinase C n=1 Tax=Harpegnathos saltator TaxID=610380 RepID=E2B923_HARSA|nr:Calcium-dependent protein kinase C [Harpegnathos saltator]